MKKIVLMLIVLTTSLYAAKVESLTQILSRKNAEKQIAATTTPDTFNQTQGAFQAKDYSTLLGMPGFSDEALKMHFKLYQGYVTNTNKMLQLLEVTGNDDNSIAYSEIKRRLMWEYDGMRLHEYYFENLGGAKSSLDTKDNLYAALVNQFGSFDAWKKDFIATGKMRGIGWVVLYYDRVSKKLINAWINEHALGHLAGGKPILIMDVFEHAYLPDYGLDRAKYIDAFFNNINWNEVSRRFQKHLKEKATSAD